MDRGLVNSQRDWFSEST